MKKQLHRRDIISSPHMTVDESRSVGLRAVLLDCVSMQAEFVRTEQPWTKPH